MVGCKLDISRKSFDDAGLEGKLGLLFDIAMAQHADTYRLAQKVDRKKKVDSGIAATSGIVGAFLFLAAKWTALKVMMGG